MNIDLSQIEDLLRKEPKDSAIQTIAHELKEHVSRCYAITQFAEHNNLSINDDIRSSFEDIRGECNVLIVIINKLLLGVMLNRLREDL